MEEKEHFNRLNRYFEKSYLGYNLLLGGSKHFGYNPTNELISEKKAQILMQELVAKKLRLSENDIVLDAGCGQGIVSAFLAQNYKCKIEGITIIPFEITKGNYLIEKLNLTDRIRYSLMDYNRMSFSNDYFDCIYTTETLSHSVNIKKTLAEFYRVLKKGGRIALFEYSIAEDNDFSESEMIILERVAKGSAMDGLKYFRHNKFQNILAEIGFSNINVDDISKNIKPSLARFKKYLFVPYYLFVKPFNLQQQYPNASAAVEFYKMADKGLIHYNIFTAIK